MNIELVGAPVVAFGLVWLMLAWRRSRGRGDAASWPGLSGSGRGHREPLIAALLAAVAVSATTTPSAGAGTGSASLVFLLDDSRSMLAADVSPSRRAVALEAIRTMLEEWTGEAALIVFAGEAVTVAPLTVDHAAVEAAVTEIQAAGVRPGAGSAPSAAITKALDMLASAETSARVVVVSDGEWTERSGLEEALERASRMGIAVSAVGVGTGAGIRLGDSADVNSQHVSRLDEDVLAAMAALTNGTYAKADDRGALSSMVLGGAGRGPANVRPWLVTGGLLVAFLMLLPVPSRGATLPDRRVGSRPTSAPRTPLMITLAVLTAACTGGDITRGNQMLAAGDAEGAAIVFEGERSRGGHTRGTASFNLGVALSRLARWDEAAAVFADSEPTLGPAARRARARFGRGVALAQGNHLADAAGAFIDALKLNPAFEDARVNLSIVRARLEREGPPSVPPARAAIPPPRYLVPRPSVASPPTAPDW